MNKKIFYLISFLFVILISLGIFLALQTFLYRDAEFKKVNNLHAEAILLAAGSGEMVNENSSEEKIMACFNVLTDHNFSKIASISPTYTTPIAVKPDNSKFYIGTKFLIYEFSGQTLTLNRVLSLDEFGFSRNEYSFDSFLATSNDSLWFDITKTNNKNILIRWDEKKALKDFYVTPLSYSGPRQIASMKAECNTYGSRGRRAKCRSVYFTPEPKLIPIDYNTKAITQRRLEWYKFLDYSPKFGWLLSSRLFYNKETDYFIMIGKDNKPKEMCYGIRAVWGADGYIYYIRKEKDLWRIHPETRVKELVFTPPVMLPNQYDYLITPVVSNDRRFLVHEYIINTKTQRYTKITTHKIIAFDLLKKQYCTVTAHGSISQFQWVIPQPKTGAEPKSSSPPKPTKE